LHVWVVNVHEARLARMRRLQKLERERTLSKEAKSPLRHLSRSHFRFRRTYLEISNIQSGKSISILQVPVKRCSSRLLPALIRPKQGRFLLIEGVLSRTTKGLS